MAADTYTNMSCYGNNAEMLRQKSLSAEPCPGQLSLFLTRHSNIKWDINGTVDDI